MSILSAMAVHVDDADHSFYFLDGGEEGNGIPVFSIGRNKEGGFHIPRFIELDVEVMDAAGMAFG